MRQVDQLRHATSNTIVDRLGRRVTLDDAASPEQHARLDRLQRNIAWIKEARALLCVLNTTNAWAYAGEEIMRGESAHTSVSDVLRP